MAEYVIWGVPPGEQTETLLLAKVRGQFITERADAERQMKSLEEHYGCTKCRIQTIAGEPINWAATVNQ